jgi:steroid delta-isomerase-like uncharacterized protein
MPNESPIEIAKASVEAYNAKNWDRVRETVAPTIVYDEVGTHRKVTGANEVISAWKGWATALPDSKATFESATASGNTVTLELTWRGTHNGPLQTPAGEIPATGRKTEIRACQVVEVGEGKVKSIRQYFDIGTLLQQIGVEK